MEYCCDALEEYSSSDEEIESISDQRNEDRDVFKAKDGTIWQEITLSLSTVGRSQQKNILKQRPGPTAFAARRIVVENPLSSFRILLSESMLSNI